MKTILLPTDFSKNSLNAINYAVKLFEDVACKFYVLHVQKASAFVSDDLISMSASTTIYNTLVDATKKSINNIISKVTAKHNNQNHVFIPLVDYDNFVDSINQSISNFKIDLIVMGTKGASGLDRVLFGSNTVHVINRVKAAVFVIPENYKFEKIAKIALASSFSLDYKLVDLELLKYFVDSYKAKLNVVHVINNDKDNETYMSENLNTLYETFSQINYRTLNYNESVYNSITHYALQNHFNVITLVTKKHTFVERFLNTNTVENFAFKAVMPLLILKTEV